MANKSAANKIPSTQQFLDIAEIKDDVVVMRDSTVRAVLLVSSINFALKGDDEQQAIIQAYVSFLNSLSFPLQIVIQSRNLRIDNYLAKLANLEKEQQNELLRMQIADYRSFLNELLEMGQIMTKKFYVIVPYSELKHEKKKFWQMFLDVFYLARLVSLSQKRFLHHKDELYKRVSYVMSGLSSIGLKAAPLDTQSLIELYYNTYNLASADAEKLTDLNKLRME
ncbi:MAG: hypothetical protein NTZ18_04235 [Candidatus Komeilibacteria bacterium]|nr:hypothetical protein [Candidatus Komeilibacteria bacterium]